MIRMFFESLHSGDAVVQMFSDRYDRYCVYEDEAEEYSTTSALG